jgi:hypothetical protein
MILIFEHQDGRAFQIGVDAPHAGEKGFETRDCGFSPPQCAGLAPAAQPVSPTPKSDRFRASAS